MIRRIEPEIENVTTEATMCLVAGSSAAANDCDTEERSVLVEDCRSTPCRINSDLSAAVASERHIHRLIDQFIQQRADMPISIAGVRSAEIQLRIIGPDFGVPLLLSSHSLNRLGHFGIRLRAMFIGRQRLLEIKRSRAVDVNVRTPRISSARCHCLFYLCIENTDAKELGRRTHITWDNSTVIAQRSHLLDFDGQFLLIARIASRCNAFAPPSDHIRDMVSQLEQSREPIAQLIAGGGEGTLRLAVLGQALGDTVEIEETELAQLGKFGSRLHVQCVSDSDWSRRVDSTPD